MPNGDEWRGPGGSALRESFKELMAVLHERQVRYALVGGLAMLQYTRVRTTDDIDVLLIVSQISMPGLFEAMQNRGFSVDVTRSIRELRDDGITVVRFGNINVDLMRPLLPAYAHVLDRAVNTEVLGQRVRVSSAESLIVMKVIAMRPQDQADIRALIVGIDNLDVGYIRGELDQIMQADDPRRIKFEGWVSELTKEK